MGRRLNKKEDALYRLDCFEKVPLIRATPFARNSIRVLSSGLDNAKNRETRWSSSYRRSTVSAFFSFYLLSYSSSS